MGNETFFDYSADKNALLISHREISFDEVVLAIDEGNLLDVVEHPNKTKYPDQNLIVVQIRSYVYLIPFVRDGSNRIFLKTIIPSRKATKQYLEGKIDHD